MPWQPSSPGVIPTLGYQVLDWMIDNLAAPDRGHYEPFYPTREQAEFIIRFYELDPHTCKRVVRRGVLSRSRGWGKSPFLSAIAITEGLADVVPDGWDAAGQPVGMPWSEVRTPLVQLAAVSEAQTKNSWRPLLEMLSEHAPALENYPGLEPLDTFVNLPRGRIEPITASATTVKGNKPVFAILDQTEEWTKTNGGVRLAETMRNNAAKLGGSLIETPNAYTPGRDSVAESTAAAYVAMREGRARQDRGLLYDHREAPPGTDMTDRESLVAGLRYAYGDSSNHPDGCVLHDPPCQPGWSPIDGLVSTIWDPDADVQTSRADFLNQITHATDAWLSQPEWAACKADAQDVPVRVLSPGDVVTLGFDGSRGKAKGKPDATALIGTRVSDGHQWEVGVWEAPDQPSTWEAWRPPELLIEAAIDNAYRLYDVVGFYGDPAAGWRSHLNKWEAKYGSRTKVKATRDHPFEWWMTGGRAGLVERAIEQLESAVRNRDMTHDGSLAFSRHILNARRRIIHGKLALAKENAYSPNKIDAAPAAVLSWQCRLAALAAGLGETKTRKAPQRIR